MTSPAPTPQNEAQEKSRPQAIVDSARRVTQGDIYRNVEHIEYVEERDGIIEVSLITFPLVVVLTQDCDLAQDATFRSSPPSTASEPIAADKILLSALVAPLYNAEHVFLGQHLSDLRRNMSQIPRGATAGKWLMNNDRPRYHYVDLTGCAPVVPSIVDFKHYFSVNVLVLERIRPTNYVCTLSELHREALSQRFASFLSRIALP